jgi:hypothetical protein
LIYIAVTAPIIRAGNRVIDDVRYFWAEIPAEGDCAAPCVVFDQPLLMFSNFASRIRDFHAPTLAWTSNCVGIAKI